MDKKINIGIISPKTYTVGGYSFDSSQRKTIRECVAKIFEYYINNSESEIVGITGLDNGSDQDFASQCIDAGIQYVVYLPYLNQEKYWPIQNEDYQELIESAHMTEYVSRGEYSPKKIIKKHKKICQDSDIIIYIWNNLKQKCSILQTILSTNKIIYIIKV